MIHLRWTQLITVEFIAHGWKTQCTYKGTHSIMSTHKLPSSGGNYGLKTHQLSSLRTGSKLFSIRRKNCFPVQEASNTQGALQGLPPRENTFTSVQWKGGAEDDPEAAVVIKHLSSYPYSMQTHPSLSWHSTGLFKDLNVEGNKYIQEKTPEEFWNIRWPSTCMVSLTKVQCGLRWISLYFLPCIWR